MPAAPGGADKKHSRDKMPPILQSTSQAGARRALPCRFRLQMRLLPTAWASAVPSSWLLRPCLTGTLTRQVKDTLQVVGLRKQIDQVRALDVISGTQQAAQIARQRSRIARHIHDARRLQRHYFVYNFFT